MYERRERVVCYLQKDDQKKEKKLKYSQGTDMT